jgi:succinate dehydrogenase/fumarate reductase cytochrome b subunit
MNGGGGKTFSWLVGQVMQNIVQWLVILGFALAFFYFMFGVVKYLTAYDNEKARGESLKTISYGLIALFVIVGLWGLVAVLSEGVLGQSRLGIPQF